MQHEQGTREWLEWRAEGIGSSDAPVLMGKSEYKTKLVLWDEKFNKTIDVQTEPTFIQLKGHRIEALTRGVFELRTGFVWSPKLFIHADYPWIRASMDGWCPELNEGWECKYMGRELYLRLIDNSLSILERIPKQYLDQICHQFFVTGAKAMHLSGVCDSLEVDDYGNKLKSFGHLRIPMTEELNKYIQEVYLPELFTFWNSIQAGERPEETKKDVIVIDASENEYHKGLLSLTEKYVEIDKDIKKLTKLKEVCKEAIFKHPSRTHSNVLCGLTQIQLLPGSLSVDYEAAFNAFTAWLYQVKTAHLNGELDALTALQNFISFPDQPNMEPYTKVSKESFKITIKKEKEEKKPDETKTVTTQDTDQKPSGNDFPFTNPVTGKVPRGWEKKTLEEKVLYLIKESKVKTHSIEHKKAFLDLADSIEQFMESKKDEQTAPADETIGGVTFIKE